MPTFNSKLASLIAKNLSFFAKGYFIYNAYWVRVLGLALFFVRLLRDPLLALNHRFKLPSSFGEQGQLY